MRALCGRFRSFPLVNSLGDDLGWSLPLLSSSLVAKRWRLEPFFGVGGVLDFSVTLALRTLPCLRRGELELSNSVPSFDTDSLKRGEEGLRVDAQLGSEFFRLRWLCFLGEKLVLSVAASLVDWERARSNVRGEKSNRFASFSV